MLSMQNARMKITPREKGRRRSRFALSTIPEEKWGTKFEVKNRTTSLNNTRTPFVCPCCDLCTVVGIPTVIYTKDR